MGARGRAWRRAGGQASGRAACGPLLPPPPHPSSPLLTPNTHRQAGATHGEETMYVRVCVCCIVYLGVFEVL